MCRNHSSTATEEVFHAAASGSNGLVGFAGSPARVIFRRVDESPPLSYVESHLRCRSCAVRVMLTPLRAWPPGGTCLFD